jgi:hypothetical protein
MRHMFYGVGWGAACLFFAAVTAVAIVRTLDPGGWYWRPPETVATVLNGPICAGPAGTYDDKCVIALVPEITRACAPTSLDPRPCHVRNLGGTYDRKAWLRNLYYPVIRYDGAVEAVKYAAERAR